MATVKRAEPIVNSDGLPKRLNQKEISDELPEKKVEPIGNKRLTTRKKTEPIGNSAGRKDRIECRLYGNKRDGDVDTSKQQWHIRVKVKGLD